MSHETARPRPVGGPSAVVVEQLRHAVQRRIADHQQRLYRDPEESRDAMNVLEQVLVERQRRVAPRPRATTITSAPPEKQPTTTRMAAAGLHSRGGAPTHQRSSCDEGTSLPKPAAAAHHASSAPLIDFYDPPTSADHHHSLHDGMQSLSVSSVTREDIELLHSENDAMELFLLRHGSDGVAAAADKAGPNVTTVGGCEMSRQQLQEELHSVVARLEALLLHTQQCQRTNNAADKTPLRQLSRQAQLCAVADNVKANNDALMQECTLLEAELDRYTIQSSSSERRRGVPWVVAHSMLPQTSTVRRGASLCRCKTRSTATPQPAVPEDQHRGRQNAVAPTQPPSTAVRGRRQRKSKQDALMQECTLLEAELDRYTIQSSSSERRRGVPWVVAHSMLPQVPPARAGVPLVVAAAWSRFTTDTKRFLDIATMQAHQARHIDDAVKGVQDGLRSQLDMILGHLRSAQLL
ncbi:Hypothetical protein, putative [Bodo saltans]|uniref:Uncharacterized protein n=1 Tax=Bodo saltans TaxID=75058 RepID=A0A0S4JS51_BODSA|nr:Hypothetical protein, putative [Bodo saltans]|eukprot:CUG93036.1 Hypothetical protein, putative [Bodo saltans]